MTSSDASCSSPHFVVLGGGSAAFSAALSASEIGARVTIINSGLPIGGTCVNVGCIPSKTLIRAAETIYRARHSHFEGVETQARIINFKEIIDQKRALVESLRKAKYLDAISGNDNIEIIEGKAALLSNNVVKVNSTLLKADLILIATGTHPHIPLIPGLDELGYLTYASAFELEELPKSMIVLGGGFIALECAQMFARMGSQVTILEEPSHIFPDETEDLTAALTEHLVSEGITVVTGVQIREAFIKEELLSLSTEINGVTKTFSAEKILIATGTTPNSKKMGLNKLGIELDENGYIKVDDFLRTNVKGIFAAGDVIGEPKSVYAAAYEGALVAQNALGSSLKMRDYSLLPWIIFTDPQVAGIGLNEAMAEKQGINFQVSSLPLNQVPRCVAARDTRGFIKLLRDRETDLLIGTRILAPEGSELVMQIAMVIKNKMTTKAIAAMLYPYLTLSEGIKLAALGFTQDIQKLSCCFSKL